MLRTPNHGNCRAGRRGHCSTAHSQQFGSCAPLWSSACTRKGPCTRHVKLSVATVELVSTSEIDSSSKTAVDQQQEEEQQQQQQRNSDRQEKPIIVGDKPATNALLRRLETAPQTLIRAQSSGSNHAYRAVTTIAAAQDGLQQPGKVLLYVPFTKSSAFTAIVLPASDTVEQVSPNTPTLTVAESTNAKELANKLSYGLIKQGGAVLLSAGAAAAAKTVQALLIVRQQLLGRGYEVGVLPRFQLGRRTDDPVTVLSQQVVLQELPVPRVQLPRNPTKPVERAAAVARSVLQKQRRVQLLLGPDQIDRLSSMMAKVMEAAPAPPEEQQPQRPGGEQDNQKKPGRQGRASRGGPEKRRLLVAWPPSTADQLLESLEQLNQFTTTALEQAPLQAATAVPPANGGGVDTAAGAVEADGLVPPAEAQLATAEGGLAVEEQPTLQLQLRPSRLTTIPSPVGGLSSSGMREDRKPAVAAAESSVSGLVGALEARVSRAGVAWLRSDGTPQGNAVAWQALFAASEKMDAADGAGGLLALVDVQPLPAAQQRKLAAATAAAGQDQAAAEQQQEQQQQQPKAEATATKQRGKQRGKQRKPKQQQVAGGDDDGNNLAQGVRMLVVRDTEVARNILQAPNSPLDVSVSADLWPLLKFATAANAFLPMDSATGTGGLILLPAVLPAPQPSSVATDYRFEDQKQQLVPYSIRLQRLTSQLPGGLNVDESQQLRVSLSTDPIKLRDAIVAKVLQQQQASVRFVGPMGRTPPLLTIAMAAVAAARVRLQQKGADVDVGVLPCAEVLRKGTAGEDSEGAGGGEGAAGLGGSRTGGSRTGRWQRNGGNAVGGGGAGGAQAARVVYSLRLVPLPAPGTPSPRGGGGGGGGSIAEGAVEAVGQLADDVLGGPDS